MSPTPPARRSRMRLILLACFAVLLPVVLVPPTAEAQPDGIHNAPDQNIDADQQVVTGPATLDLGHVDLGPRLVDGVWTLMVHDDTVDPSVWRPLDEVVVAVSDGAVAQVPDDDRYDFLGLEPGAPVHVIPQTQRPDVVWLGWNTQAPDVIAQVDRGVTMTLLGVDGPGYLTVYLQAGTMEPPDVLWRSTDAEARPLFVDVNTHTHANWLFSEPGVYLARLQVSADLIDGTSVTDIQTLRFAVGDQTNPETAREVVYLGPELTTPSTADDATTETGSAPTNGEGPSIAIVIAGLAAVVVLLAVAVTVWRSRRVRQVAESAASGGEAP